MVLKYFEIGNDIEGNRVEYTRYICLPYTRKRTHFIHAYMERMSLLIKEFHGWYVKRKFVTGKQNIKDYLEHLKCKVTKVRDGGYDIREPITARIYSPNQTLPHENTLRYNRPFVFHDCFGDQIISDDEVGVNLRSL